MLLFVLLLLLFDLFCSLLYINSGLAFLALFAPGSDKCVYHVDFEAS